MYHSRHSCLRKQLFHGPLVMKPSRYNAMSTTRSHRLISDVQAPGSRCDQPSRTLPSKASARAGILFVENGSFCACFCQGAQRSKAAALMLAAVRSCGSTVRLLCSQLRLNVSPAVLTIACPATDGVTLDAIWRCKSYPYASSLLLQTTFASLVQLRGVNFSVDSVPSHALLLRLACQQSTSHALNLTQIVTSSWGHRSSRH